MGYKDFMKTIAKLSKSDLFVDELVFKVRELAEQENLRISLDDLDVLKLIDLAESYLPSSVG